MLHRKLASSFRRALHRNLESRLIPPSLLSPIAWPDLLEDVLQITGAELISVLKVRVDVRGIYIVRHPVFGRCVLKTINGAHTPAKTIDCQGPTERELAAQFRARLVQNSGAPFFPTILEIGPYWTLEEFIDGRPFRAWMDAQFHRVPVARYFGALRQWSRSSLIEGGSPYLPHWQVRETCRDYLTKCLRHSRYFNVHSNIGSFRKLVSRQSRVREQIQWLDEAAASVRIPSGLMCGDMGNVNLLVSRKGDQIFNIDHEYLGAGHWGFDCAYFLSSLAKLPHDPAVLDELRKIFADNLADEAERVQEFFSVLTDTLTKISTTVYGRGR